MNGFIKKKSDTNNQNEIKTKSTSMSLLSDTSNSKNNKNIRKHESILASTISKANTKKSKLSGLNNNFAQASSKYPPLSTLSALNKNTPKENSFFTTNSTSQKINENSSNLFTTINTHSPNYLNSGNNSPTQITTISTANNTNIGSTNNYLNNNFYQNNASQYSSNLKNFENSCFLQNNEAINGIHNFYYQQQNQTSSTSPYINNGYNNQHAYQPNYQLQLQQHNNYQYQPYYYYPTPESSPDVQFQILNDAAALTAAATHHFLASNSNLNSTQHQASYNLTTNTQVSNFPGNHAPSLHFQTSYKKASQFSSPSTSSSSSSPSSSVSSISLNTAHNQFELTNNRITSSLKPNLNLTDSNQINNDSNSNNMNFESLNNYNYSCNTQSCYEKQNNNENPACIAPPNISAEQSNIVLSRSNEELLSSKNSLERLTYSFTDSSNNIMNTSHYITSKDAVNLKID
jgi:hypothetical protein